MLQSATKQKVINQKIADKLGVTHQTISNWISDTRRKQTAVRNNLILKLNLLRYSGVEISRDFLNNSIKSNFVNQIIQHKKKEKIYE